MAKAHAAAILNRSADKRQKVCCTVRCSRPF